MLAQVGLRPGIISGEEIVADLRYPGPAHAVYFGTYELVKEMAGGNVDDGHHPLAAGRFSFGVEGINSRRMADDC